MQFTDFGKLDLSRLPSPCFVVDEVAVERNLRILHGVAVASGAKVLGALKAFSMWSLGDLTQNYLNGTCASGLHEARLGYEEYGGEVHVFAAAFSQADIDELLTFANHIVFNSCSQWLRFREQCLAVQQQRPDLEFGLRINPEHSEGAVPIYDPCSPGSRLGITLSQLDESALAGISGLHFHTLCEQGFEPLERTVAAVESKFGHILPQMKWVNFGGGHHITADGYDINGLVELIQAFQSRHDVQVYLEPGEAMAIGTGILSCEVLDITWNKLNQAILDTSATCHMPDTLEMPYRPDIHGAGEADEFEYTYRLGGLTCLAGDVIDDYSFKEPLEVGQRLIFEDMAHYTMVKTTTFNGTKLPAIALWNSETDALRIVKEFGYDDFKHRLS
ncbi:MULTISPECIES: carboxynorspermidine decarboxylase [unclassified Methylophaga]|jgi:carboxynorspermidine decarboxylase|uniref:carboxynorspermidine decarboxylase n=2 Tax=Methylophaga TaxID=40222 RepID=UPI00259D075B|nr:MULTISPECIES: carboxynorspermidine decarboxylase [unclassified Methylophaga]|tara:strand:+ start:12238 stop:13404 length:1167 start_codon:yes stop_codon:yes gene_type:complete